MCKVTSGAQPFIQHTERLQQLANAFQITEEPEESVEYLKILASQARESLLQAKQRTGGSGTG